MSNKYQGLYAVGDALSDMGKIYAQYRLNEANKKANEFMINQFANQYNTQGQPSVDVGGQRVGNNNNSETPNPNAIPSLVAVPNNNFNINEIAKLNNTIKTANDNIIQLNTAKNNGLLGLLNNNWESEKKYDAERSKMVDDLSNEPMSAKEYSDAKDEIYNKPFQINYSTDKSKLENDYEHKINKEQNDIDIARKSLNLQEKNVNAEMKRIYPNATDEEINAMPIENKVDLINRTNNANKVALPNQGNITSSITSTPAPNTDTLDPEQSNINAQNGIISNLSNAGDAPKVSIPNQKQGATPPNNPTWVNQEAIKYRNDLGNYAKKVNDIKNSILANEDVQYLMQRDPEGTMQRINNMIAQRITAPIKPNKVEYKQGEDGKWYVESESGLTNTGMGTGKLPHYEYFNETTRDSKGNETVLRVQYNPLTGEKKYIGEGEKAPRTSIHIDNGGKDNKDYPLEKLIKAKTDLFENENLKHKEGESRTVKNDIDLEVNKKTSEYKAELYNVSARILKDRDPKNAIKPFIDAAKKTNNNFEKETPEAKKRILYKIRDKAGLKSSDAIQVLGEIIDAYSYGVLK